MTDYSHPSGLPDAYDRASSAPDRARLVFPEGAFLQGADLNELQSLEARRNKRVGQMVAKDGDRISGAAIIVNSIASTVTLDSGSIYISGDVRPVASATLTGIPMTGTVQIGVRLQTTLVTYADDPSLLGLQPGSEAEGQPGAARQNEVIVWAVSTDTQDGDFFPVYLIKDGTVIDQTPPPSLTGVNAAIASYDRDAHGSYIVSGCEVTALGKIGTDQIFSIQSGVANINGFKRSRDYALRHAQTEDPDLISNPAEPHSYTGTLSTVVTVNHPPIAAVQQAIVTKRVTETVLRGLTAGGTDALGNSSVVAIESVVQGGTTFSSSAYTLAGDAVSWAPAGSEPAASSTYQVTYLYNAAVTPDAITDTTVTVSGGVIGQPVLISYTSKLPRVDLLCLDQSGNSVMVKGISARSGAIAPLTPSTLLKLAEVSNDWYNLPTIKNDGTHALTFDQLARVVSRLLTVLDEFDRSALANDITSRAPVAKQGIFTDTFADDFYRDQGEAQTAAIVDGTVQLAVDAVSISRLLDTAAFLPYTEEIVIRQDLATSSRKINPYANLSRMPSALALTPSVDYWTDQVTEWTSPVTQQFSGGLTVPPNSTVSGIITSSTTINEVVSERSTVATTLRQISVAWALSGFGVGENLATLTFDGVDVKPAGTQTADSNGRISGTFTIPAGIPTGSRRVRATGAAGSFAEAIFVGSGQIEVDTMRKVTLVQRIPQITSTNPATVNQSLFRRPDPLAQTFTLDEDRQIVGLNFKFTNIGDRTKGVRVQILDTANGYPADTVLAEAFVDMTSVVTTALTQARFVAPVFLHSDREYAICIMTDDPNHAVAISRLGDVDTATQTFVASQPYTVGVLFSSANHSAWTAEQDADLTFQLVAASFSATSLSVPLGTFALSTISDVVARASVELPTADAGFRFELVRADSSVVKLASDQTLSFDSYVSETVTLRAILTGTAKISPCLFPGAIFATGRIRTSGTYVTRAFQMGSAVAVNAIMAALLPAGSSVSVDCDATDDSWQSMTIGTTGALGGGWIEPKFTKSSFTATNGRVRITLAGGPGARPAVARLRAYSI